MKVYWYKDLKDNEKMVSFDVKIFGVPLSLQFIGVEERDIKPEKKMVLKTTPLPLNSQINITTSGYLYINGSHLDGAGTNFTINYEVEE